MALSKSIASCFGVNATYWNISQVIEDFRNGGVQLLLSGYVSKDTRDLMYMQIASESIGIPSESYSPEMSREQIYTYLKSTPGWSDAEDC